MAAINDLINQIQDEALRTRIEQEMERMQKRQKFGLVYENHEPECAMLPDVKIRRGTKVTRRMGKISKVYKVQGIEGDTAVCTHDGADDAEPERIALAELVAVAQFGEPIFPYLKSMDRVQNAPDSDLWHTLIEADNFHALQLLTYLYGGKVDCIYIDPPYNTGARDWKYNNDYVDSSDQYRHSKWLSMMEKRLQLAKKLLNPADSVLIVTIDEKEYLHLGCLLEQMFPEANIQMVSSVIAQSGVARANSFYRTNEYLYFIQFGHSMIQKLPLSSEWQLGKSESQGAKGIVWNQLRRTGTNSLRTDRPNLFYPIFFNKGGSKILGVGESMPLNEHPCSVLEEKDNHLLLWPIRPNGIEANWQISADEFKERLSKGYIKWSKITSTGIYVTFLKKGSIDKIEKDEVKLVGRDELSGTVIVDSSRYLRSFIPGTMWNIASHDASYKGSQLLDKIIGKRFDFPKSLYAVHDAIRFFVANKPNALIVDFFAGSGTTLHAVNLLNKEDGGKRRCIMVTNNEVSEDEAKALTAKGYKPGDEEWERLGIARYVNWPRTQCSIKGIDVNGKAIVGDYITTLTEEKRTARQIKQLEFDIPQGRNDKKVKKQLVSLLGKNKLAQSLVSDDCKYIVSEDYPVSILFDDSAATDWLDELDGQDHIKEFYVVTHNNKLFKQLKNEIAELLGDYVENVPVTFPMSDGFAANAEYFKLGFLDKTSVALGRQFRELLPLLWMKAGAHGERPTIADGDDIPSMLVLPSNHLAILTDEAWMDEFATEVKAKEEIKTAFIVTDSEPTFQEVNHALPEVECYQLYSDYLDNFRINCIKR